MKTKRLVIVIVVCCVLLLGGCGLVVGLVVVPALSSSGLGEAFVAALRLAATLNESGLVDNANVKFGTNFQNGRRVHSLTVECHWRGSDEADESAATRVAAIVLDAYGRIDEVDVLTVSFVQRTQAGPITLRRGQAYSHPPADWRARRQKLSV